MLTTWGLAKHLDEDLSDEASADLDLIFAIEDGGEFEKAFWMFLEQEFPGCVALMPPKRRKQFLKRFCMVMEMRDWRFP